METGTHMLTPPGAMLKRGFWLCEWKVTTADGDELLCVERTGDSSSHEAARPYSRMGQHLGHVKASNALRAHLVRRGIEPETCAESDLIAHGPLFDEQQDMGSHQGSRDIVPALERELACALEAAGHKVMNKVNCRKETDPKLWRVVRDAFFSSLRVI